MLVHGKKKRRRAVQVPLTSLIDMVFLLLIYFMLTTNYMVDEGIKVNLPKAASPSLEQEEVVTVYVNREGKVFFHNRCWQMEALRGEFSRLFAGRQAHKSLIVKADRKVDLERVVTVMDMASACGARNMGLATDKGN